MKITVTTSSQTLDAILSAAQKAQLTSSASGWAWAWVNNILIQNKGANTIYIDFGAAATTTTCVEIVTDATFAFETIDLTDTYLIAATWSNTDVMLACN